MLSERTLNFIKQLEKNAAESSSGAQQRKYKETRTYSNNAGSGTALGAGLGALTGAALPSKYRALGIGLGSLTGAGIGNFIGRNTVNKKVQKSQEVNLKREEKKNENAKIPRLNSPAQVRYIK